MARRPIGSTARPAEDRAVSRDFWLLADLWPFVKPYRWRLATAVTAAGVAAIMVLALGRGIGALIDSGFGTGNAGLLDQALLIIVAGTAVLVLATFVRVSLLAAVGEQVVADIRRQLYRHVISLSPAFFESTRTGEVLSRLTVDATLLQTVVATSASVALRNL